MAKSKIEVVECKETRNESIVHLVDDISCDGFRSSWKRFGLPMRRGIATEAMQRFSSTRHMDMMLIICSDEGKNLFYLLGKCCVVQSYSFNPCPLSKR